MDGYTQQMPEAWQLQRDWSPLPEVDTSLFEPTYLDSGAQGAFGFSAPAPSASLADGAQGGFKFADAQVPPDLSLNISPFEHVAPHEQLSAVSSASPYTSSPYSACSYPSSQPSVDPMSGMALDGSWFPHSGPSSAFSGSPSPSESSLPAPTSMPMAEPYIAPQPQHAHRQAFDGWAQHVETHGMMEPVDCKHALADMQALGLEMCPQPELDMQMGYAEYEHAQAGMFSQGYSQELEEYAFQESVASQPELAY